MLRREKGQVLMRVVQADQIIPYGGTRNYYNAVTEVDPDVQSFYRLFEAPGLSHCAGGPGGYPAETFQALVKWVEEGVAPDSLLAANPQTNQSRILCAYPKKAKFVGEGPEYEAGDFVCE